MPEQNFLEKYPLYKKFNIAIPNTIDRIPRPPIHMHCQKCESEQTFNMNRTYEPNLYVNDKSHGKNYLARYTCAGCSVFERDFLLKFGEELDYVVKVGQYPPWDINIEKNLSKMLGQHERVYKNGLICESQGFGVGAYAYYRKIVELIMDELLDSITELLSGEEKSTYEEALKKTKKERNAQDKIKLVQDLLPPILKPSGMNPLSTLHGILSEGIHEKTDEECLEIAGNIREVLIFMTNQVIVSRSAGKKFTDSMKKLLEKKSKN